MATTIAQLADGVSIKVLPGKIVFLKDGIVFKSIGPSRDGDFSHIVMEVYTLACSNSVVRENWKQILELCTEYSMDRLSMRYICVVPSNETPQDKLQLSSITDVEGKGYYMGRVSDMVFVDSSESSYYSCYNGAEEAQARLAFILMTLGFFFGQPCPSNWSVRERGSDASISTLTRMQKFCSTYF